MEKINKFTEVTEEMEKPLNPLQSFLLHLHSEEWANGSDRLGYQIGEIINSKDFHTLTPYQMAEKIHLFYYQETLLQLEQWEKRNSITLLNHLIQSAKAEGQTDIQNSLQWTLDHMEVWEDQKDLGNQIWDNIIHKV